MSVIECQVLDVEGRLLKSGSEVQILGWLSSVETVWEREPVYVRVGSTGRVIPVSDHIKYAELRGFKKTSKMDAVREILNEYVSVRGDALNQAELEAVCDDAAAKIIALFEGK